MRFADFINIEQTGFAQGKVFASVMGKFLRSPVLAPFTDAVFRYDETVLEFRQIINPMLHEYWDVYTNLPAYKVVYGFMGLFTEEQKANFNAEAILANSAKVIMVNTQCLEIERKIEVVTVTCGLRALEKEHRHAERRMFETICDAYRIPGINEYVAFCLELCTGTSQHDVYSASLQQIIGYLSILQVFLKPFKESNFYSEHRTQAQKLDEAIAGILGKIQDTQKKFLVRVAEVEAHEARISDLNKDYFDSTSKPRDLPEGHDSAGCLLCETPEEHQMQKAEFSERLALHQELEEASNGILKEYISIFSNDPVQQTGEIGACLNYWNQRLPKIYSRIPVLRVLESFALSEGQNSKTIYRYISEGELVSLKKLCYFSLYEQAIEREKWFFTKKAQPGAGVQHEYICEILLQPGAFELLRDHIQADGQKAAIVEKENEGDCFGLHEDALPFFSRMIKGIGVKKRNTDELAWSCPHFGVATLDTPMRHLYFQFEFGDGPVPYINPTDREPVEQATALARGEYVKSEYFKKI